MSTIFNAIKNKNLKENPMKNSVENRKAILEVNGISPDGYVALSLNGLLVKLDAQGNKIEENKEIVGGNIQNPKLYRRWVMAQFFRQYNDPRGYAKVISDLPLSYQWKAISEELKTLAKLEREDYDYFFERTYFFNIDVITNILMEYVEQLHNTIDHKKVKKCKGIPYITIAGQNIFRPDLRKKIFIPLDTDIRRFRDCQNYSQASREFDRIKKKWLMKYRVDRKKVTQIFKDAYKGAGAYYTLQNMVVYHSCKLNQYSNKKVICTHFGMDAYKYMRSLLFSGQIENYQWIGMLRQCIKDNNFSFNKAA